MKYIIKSITIKANDYNPIKHLLCYAVQLELKNRKKYKAYNSVIHENPYSPKPYLEGFIVDIISYNNISFNSQTSKKVIKETIEAMENCDLKIESVYNDIEFHDYLIWGNDNGYPDNKIMEFMIYLPFLIDTDYISPTLKNQYIEKIKCYIEKQTKAKVWRIC